MAEVLSYEPIRSKLSLAIEELGRGSGVAIRTGAARGCLLIFSLGISGGALAQQSSLGADQEVIEEITTTGSRIGRSGMATANPVTAVQQDELQKMAPTLLMNSIDMLPQFRENNTSEQSSVFGTAGANNVNLRGIGANRTLVLLDSRRVVSSTQRGSVDIALFPQPLVQRMEVVTGGASAAYGSDAVAGVVNFILDTEFTGFKTEVQTGITDRSDRENVQFSVTGGMPLGDSFHIVASADYYTADGIQGYDGRDWQQNWGMIFNPGETPQRRIGPNARAIALSDAGVITSGPLHGLQFNNEGELVPLHPGEFATRSGQFGGGGTNTALDHAQLVPDDERHTAFAHLSYDATEDLNLFFQAHYGSHEVEAANSFGFAGPWQFTIFQDNAFLRDSVRQRMIDEGIESFTMGKHWPEVYEPRRSSRNQMTSLTTGLDWQVGSWLMDAYYQYGQNVQHANYATNNKQVRTDRIYRAVDAIRDPLTGAIVCRSQVEGPTPEEEAAMTMVSGNGVVLHGDPLSNSLCMPLDPFGTGTPDPSALQYVQTGNHHRQEVEQHFAEVTLQRDFALDWFPESVSFLTGASYREDSVFQDAFGNDVDPRDLNGLFAALPGEQVGVKGMPAVVENSEVFFIGNPNADGTPIQGSFDVWEVFAETYVPLLRDVAGESLDLNIGLRHAEYSGSGGVQAAKIGPDWQITNDLRLRATWSRDVRAATLSERFDSQGGGATVQDPFNPELEPYLTTLRLGGNPEVAPEEADTWTAGVVYQPSWAPGLGMSVDVYDITIQDAISQLGPQAIVDECFAGASSLCNLVTFNDEGQIQEVEDVFINVAEAKTRGVDLEVQYRRPVTLFGNGTEDISLRGFANFTDQVSEQNVGAPERDRAGERTVPELILLGSITYNNGPFSLFWQTRYRDSTVRDNRWIEGVDIDDNHVGSMTTSNINLSYTVDSTVGSFQLFGHIANVFDRDPPRTPSSPSGITGGFTHTINQFDVLGRRYNLGFRMQF